MDWQAFGDFVDQVGGVAVGLAGAIVAGLAVVFTHRERTSEYRTHLFEQQVAVMMDVADQSAQVLRDILRSAIDRHAAGGGDGPLAADHEARESLIRLRQRAQIVLPDAVNLAFGSFMEQVFNVSGTGTIGGAPAVAPRIDRDSTDRLLHDYYALIAAIRDALGIDALSQESAGLFAGARKTTRA